MVGVPLVLSLATNRRVLTDEIVCITQNFDQVVGENATNKATISFLHLRRKLMHKRYHPRPASVEDTNKWIE
jgi:hypothetical protein